MTHIIALIFISFVVSLVFAFMMRDSVKDRLLFGAKMFLGLLGFSIIAGWIAYFIPF